ncbi:MAG: hypothetical protein NC095_11560 [Muribaculum sp.]|nr:hypothetical protein [Muribaculum sp.]
MKPIKKSFLFFSLIVLWANCFAAIPKGRIFRSEFSATEASRMEIWDMLWPGGSPISPDSSKGRLIFYDDTKARNRVNRYKEILNQDCDTLYLFLCNRTDKAPYCTYGWTTRGDSLILGDTDFMSRRPPGFEPSMVAGYMSVWYLETSPILKYIPDWNTDYISSTWPYVGHDLYWAFWGYWPDYVFRLTISENTVRAEGVEICFWQGKYGTPEDVREFLDPLSDNPISDKHWENPTLSGSIDLIINDDAP